MNESGISSGSKTTIGIVKFWDDDKAELHPSRLRKEIPPMPKVTTELEVVKGGFETFCYLALQIRKTKDKGLIIRCLASAVAILMQDSNRNYTGTGSPPIQLTGLEVVAQEIEDRSQVITTNLQGAEPVTLAEMDAVMDVDFDEIGSYFGVLCFAGVKTVNRENRRAFNQNRQNAVQSTTIGEMKIFVLDSPWLEDAILQKMYAAFNSYLPVRSHIIYNAVTKIDHNAMGMQLAFTTMFLLLADQGMSALRIIKEALVKHRWIRVEFPEIHAEIEMAQEGVNSIMKATARERPFLKAIHGAAYVPVSYQSIANLTGLCKFVLKETTVSYAQYTGGKVTEAQEAKLVRIMTERGLMRATAEVSAQVVQE